MQRSRLVMPITLGLCLATPMVAATAAPPTTFDGSYRGSMTQEASGLNDAYTGPNCETMRSVAMLIRHGDLFMSYNDYHGHTIHYSGRVNANGRVNAYHRNSDGSSSLLTGNVSGSQFTAEIQRGKCDYTVTLTKG